MKRLFSFTLALMMLLLVSCQTSEPMESMSSNSSTIQPTLIGRSGNTITIPTSTEKIISLSPSATEMLIDLGLGSKIIGVDTTFSQPKEVSPSTLSFDMMSPDIEKIISLSPDLVIASMLTTGGSGDPLSKIKDSGVCVTYIPSSENIDGIQEDLRFIAELTKTTEKANKIIEQMDAQIIIIQNLSSVESFTSKKILFVVGSTPTIYTCGNETYLNELIQIIGCENIFADQNGWLPVSTESIVIKNPDIIFTNEGYLEDPIAAMKNYSGLENVNAVKNDQIFYIDADSSSRPNERILLALHQMADAVGLDVPDYEII